MTTSLNNIEKLIQMATIDHMFSMLQKMKSDNENQNEKNDKNKYQQREEIGRGEIGREEIGPQGAIECKVSEDTAKLMGSFLREISTLKQQQILFFKNIENNNEKMEMKIQELEKELISIKNNSVCQDLMVKSLVDQQIKGQTLLTSFPGFSNKIKEDSNVITLKIEEKDEENEEQEEDDEEEKSVTIVSQDIPVVEVPVVEVPVVEETEEEEEEEEEEEVGTEEEEEISDDEDINPLMVTCSEVSIKKLNVDVGTEEEEVEDEEEDVPEVTIVSQDIPVVEAPVEEEEEEVFEIEIDDITYFATGEENGVLYEMTSDGEVGKKVGIIKDGEPIF